jgi:hypothetical protein
MASAISSVPQRFDPVDLLAGRVLAGVAEMVHQFAIDRAGLHHADPNPFAEQFLAERFGEPVRAELGQV